MNWTRIDPETLTSRFIRTGDAASPIFVFPLHPAWWSRQYEYAWAARFAGTGDTALDAACGLCHPLKFHLLDCCRDVHACDLDPRILSPDAIREEILESFGEDAANRYSTERIARIHFAHASICSLSYADGMFDKVYCISTLEHLKDRFNKHPGLLPARDLLSCLPIRQDMYRALRELRRVLSPTGLLVLTFDFPDIHLGYFRRIVDELGLAFGGETDFTLPPDALHSSDMGLYCFRAVLRARLK